MGVPEKQNPGWRAGAFGKSAGERKFHVQYATAEPLLQRLDGVQKSGNGWRARCPSCGGRSRKLSVAEVDGKVLVHCFGGCRGDEVIGAVGLSWADLFPPRTWPDSPEQQRVQRRAIREAGWSSALSVLALEAKVALIAARELAKGQPLSDADDDRLHQAVKRIDHAANVLVEVRR